MLPRVSIILPTFNRLEFLGPAIDSVLRQTYTDWELIIADDGSAGETRAYLETLADARVRVLWLGHSGKPSVARNAAMRTARGQYLAFMDSDDVWAPQKLEMQLRAMLGAPGRRWSYTAIWMIDIEGQTIPDDAYKPRLPYDGDIVERLLTLDALIATPSVMVERSLVDDVGGFDEAITVNEDQDLWLRLAMRSPVAHVAERLTGVRVKRVDPRYPHNDVGSGEGWVRLYGKAAASLQDPRLRAIARRQRAQRARQWARDLAAAGDRWGAAKIAVASRVQWLILMLGLAVVLGVMGRVPQGIYGDQASQLRAARQYVEGKSPSLNMVIQPDAADLSRDRRIWIVSRPPGPQIAAYPFLAAGLSIGAAVRIVAVLCLIVGSVGWLRWYEQFDAPTWVLSIVAAALPFLHEASNGLYVFTQDTLSYAIAPWVLLLVLRSARRGAFGMGLALGVTYVVKYSLFFLGLGALVWLGVERSWRRLWWVAAGAAIPVVVLSLLNAHFGVAVNSVTAQAGWYPHWESFAALIADPALAVTDADGLLGRLHASSYVGVAPGLVMLWLIVHGARMPAVRAVAAARLAVIAFVVTMILIAAVWTFTSFAADLTARHVAPASLAVLPVAVLGAVDVWRHRGWLLRAVVAFTGCAIVLVPTLYGALALPAKAFRIPRTYRVGPSGVLNPNLAPIPGAPDDLATVEHRIIGQFAAVTDVWVCDNSTTPLDLPGRVLADVDERYPANEFRSSRRLRITALIQAKLEPTGDGAATRARFKGAGPWTETQIPGALANVWTSVLEPSAAP
ncbi:MAG TPA: glycosyltransferase [Gemmatimonadaceae bacterium]|nr:glycosyltransferase [Gemmatimonadaceae bacterium]